MRYLYFLCFSLILLGCKKESPTSISIYVDSDIKTGSVADTFFGRAIKVDAFRVYLSNIKLLTTNADTIDVADYFLYEYPTQGLSALVAELDVPANSVASLIFSVGLDPALNNSNPVTFPAGHPLSLDKDMHWGMLKYRFLVVEGGMDSTASKTGPVNFPFSLHLGTDTLYREKFFYLTTRNAQELHIQIDPLMLFWGYALPPLDPRQHYSNHSSPLEIPDAIELMDNFASRITLKQVVSLPD